LNKRLNNQFLTGMRSARWPSLFIHNAHTHTHTHTSFQCQINERAIMTQTVEMEPPWSPEQQNNRIYRSQCEIRVSNFINLI